MASPRSIMTKATQTPYAKMPRVESRLNRLVSKRVRFGNIIRIHQLGSLPQTKKEAELFNEIRAQRQKGEASLSRRKLDQLRAKEYLLRLSLGLRKRGGGRDPSMYQILAVAALRFGLNSKELDGLSRIMANISTNIPKQVSWEGDPSGIRKAIKRKVVGRLEERLFHHPGAISSKDLAKSLGMEWDKKRKTINLLNPSLQLLEICGLVKKMPLSTLDGCSVWAHRSHPNPKMNYFNIDFHLLERLLSGRKYFTDLYREKRVLRDGKTTVFGNPDEVFGMGHVLPVLNKLEKLGLVKLTRTRLTNITKEKRGTVLIGEAELTPEGMRLMKQYAETNSLPEKLRRLLLGQREVKKEEK